MCIPIHRVRPDKRDAIRKCRIEALSSVHTFEEMTGCDAILHPLCRGREVKRHHRTTLCAQQISRQLDCYKEADNTLSGSNGYGRHVLTW